MPGHVIVSAVLWLLLLATYAGFYLWGRRAERRRLARRHGGYVRVTALSGSKAARGGTSTAASTAARSSSWTQPGGALAAAVAPVMPVLPSSVIALGSSGSVTADLGASGRTRPAPAAYLDYCECGAHVVGTPCYAPRDSQGRLTA